MTETSKTRVTRAQRHQQVVKLLDEGLTLRQVAKKLGLGLSTVTAAYYDPDGSKERERKHRRHGNCLDCGTETYNGGSVKVPERCAECHKKWQRTDPEYMRKASEGAMGRGKKYTRNAILFDLRAAAGEDGRLTGDQYNAWREKHGGPSEPLIIKRFDTWQKALKAAGLQVDHPRKGYYANRTTNEAILDMVWACARDLGRRPSSKEYESWQRDRTWAVSLSTVRNRLGNWHKATEKAGVNDMNGGVT